MTIVSDGTLRRMIEEGSLSIDPFDPEMVQPASIDVRASGHFRVFRNGGITHIDPRIDQPNLTEETIQEGDEPFVLHPGEFVLGSTVERFRLPDHVVGRLEGKSSLGRLGLVIHSTAGFIDPGFDGTITLELSNNATLPITLWGGNPIGQVSFQFLDHPCEVPYGDAKRNSKYQGQVDPTASRMHKNFELHEVEVVDEEDPRGSGVVKSSQFQFPIPMRLSNAAALMFKEGCRCTFYGHPIKSKRYPQPDCPIHVTKESSQMPDKSFYKMDGVRLGRVQVHGTAQKRILGEVIAEAIISGREIQVKSGKHRSVLVLTSAADDLGHVWKIDPEGGFKDIGVTEKMGE